MKKFKVKNGKVTINVPEEMFNAVRKESKKECDELLAERYTISLPLYSLKRLLEIGAKDMILYEIDAKTIGVTTADDLIHNAALETGKIIINCLDRNGLDGNKIADEIFVRTKQQLWDSVKS